VDSSRFFVRHIEKYYTQSAIFMGTKAAAYLDQAEGKGGLNMAFTDEAIIKQRAEAEQRKRESHIDLTKEQILYGEAYNFMPKQFFDDRLEFLMPREFSLMPEHMAAEKYITAQRPQVILSNRDCTVDITLNLLEDLLKAIQIPLCLQKLKNTIHEVYPATLFFDAELIDTNNATIAYMDFKSFSLGGPVYNIMFVSAVCGMPLIGTFNCSFERWEQWRPVVLEMLKTMREVEKKS